MKSITFRQLVNHLYITERNIVEAQLKEAREAEVRDPEEIEALNERLDILKDQKNTLLVGSVSMQELWESDLLPECEDHLRTEYLFNTLNELWKIE